MSGTQARPVVVGLEIKLQRINMRILEGPSSQPVTITSLTELNGTFTGLPSQASTALTIRHHLRCYQMTPRGGDGMSPKEDTAKAPCYLLSKTRPRIRSKKPRPYKIVM